MKQLENFDLLCQYIMPIGENDYLPINEGIFKSHDWDKILALANEYLVTPSLYLGLVKRDLLKHLDIDVCNFLEAIYYLNGERNAGLKEQALSVIQLMNSEDIQPILLKGVAGLLTGLYEDDGERVIGDIDLLVDKSELDKVVRLLTANGYQCDSNIQAAVSNHSFYLRELCLVPDAGIANIDLHVRPACSGSNAFVSSENARNQAASLVLGAATALLPPFCFRLMHNFYHAQSLDRCYLNGSINLRQLIDWIHLLKMAGSSVSYVEISDQLYQHGLSHSFVLYVLNADRLLKQPIPANIKINLFVELLYFRQRLCLQYRWLYKINALITFLCRGGLAFAPERINLGFGDLPLLNLLILFINKFLDPAWHMRRLNRIKDLLLVLFADRQ